MCPWRSSGGGSWGEGRRSFPAKDSVWTLRSKHILLETLLDWWHNLWWIVAQCCEIGGRGQFSIRHVHVSTLLWPCFYTPWPLSCWPASHYKSLLDSFCTYFLLSLVHCQNPLLLHRVGKQNVSNDHRTTVECKQAKCCCELQLTWFWFLLHSRCQYLQLWSIPGCST